MDHYRLLTVSMAVTSESPEIAAALRWHLEEFHTQSGDDSVVEISIERDSDEGWRYVREGAVRRTGPQRRILKYALWDILALVHRRVDEFLLMHAGSVALDGRALLLPAGEEVGKSTLTAALLARGFAYLSDEFAVLDSHARAHPFPKRITLDPAALSWLPGLEERLGDRTGLSGELDQRYARPSDLGATVAQATEVAWVVFHTRNRQAPPRLTPLGGAELFNELAAASFNLPRRRESFLDRLALVGRSAQAFRLDGGLPSQRADVIERLCRSR